MRLTTRGHSYSTVNTVQCDALHIHYRNSDSRVSYYTTEDTHIDMTDSAHLFAH